MKNLLTGVLAAMVISATAQTNVPVVQVKKFRASGTCKVTLGIRGATRTLHGEVLAVYSNRFMFEVNEPARPDIDGKLIIIQNYPSMDSLANGQKLSFPAQNIGTIQGLNEDGTLAIGKVLELWDYYTPPVPTPEEIAAAKAAQEKARADAKIKSAEQKKLAEARALQSNQAAAAKGDLFGLMRMGERYRDGDGVEKDLGKARDYLQKASDAGSPTAKDELSKLPIPKN